MSKNTNKPMFVCITDTHLKVTNLDLVYDIFVQLVEHCYVLKCYRVVHLRDWFNSREEQPFECLLMCQKIKNYLQEMGIQLITIVGNHDKVDLSKSESYLDIYSNDDLFKVIGEFEVITFGSVAVHFLSYFKEGSVYKEKLLKAQNESVKYSKNILCTHTAISGVRNNGGGIVENENPSNGYNCFDLVLVGHYHNKQKVGSRINYIGSAYQANFGEDEEKGITIVYDNLAIEQVQLNFPKFKQFKINVDDDKLISKSLAEISNEVDGGSGDNYRVLFCGDKNKVELFNVSGFLSMGVECKKEGIVNEVEFDEIEDAELVVFDNNMLGLEWVKYATENKFNKKHLSGGSILIKETN